MKNPLKTLDANLHGKDYVIGDLHGSYSIFENLLNGIKFDKTKDRIISVGDLINRGPDSLKCIKLLHEPWFHTVYANHESMMVGKFRGTEEGIFWFQNGGEWAIDAFERFTTPQYGSPTANLSSLGADLMDTIPIIEELPYMITVNTKIGKKFHIIHAEMPTSNTPITDELLSDPYEVYRLATIQSRYGDSFLWARHLFNSFYSANLENRSKIMRTIGHVCDLRMFNDNLSHIISGHTILQRPMTIVGQTGIDTGAFDSYHTGRLYSDKPPKWAALSCVDLDTWKFYQATETVFREVDPFTVSMADLLGKS